MKTKRIFFLLTLMLLVVAACSPTPAATVDSNALPATVAPTVVVVEPTQPAPAATETSAPIVEATQPPAAPTLTDAEMEALIFEKAKTKHTLDFILSQNKTAEEWSKTLDRMIGYGAKISPEEKELIINWLVSRKK